MNRIAMIVLKNLHRVPFITAKLFFCAAHQNQYSKQQKYQFIQSIAERIRKTGNVDIQVFGKENIPKENGFIFYPNHQGLFDGVAMLTACDVPFSPVMKQELTSVPFVKQIFICLESLPMNREDIRQSIKVIQNVADRVKKKENCLIFPEGTRSRKGNELLEFKGGSFKAALKAKCPVVPVALIDSFRPFDQPGTAHVTVQVHILKPIQYEAYQGMPTVTLAALVKAQIEAVIAANG